MANKINFVSFRGGGDRPNRPPLDPPLPTPLHKVFVHLRLDQVFIDEQRDESNDKVLTRCSAV